MTVAEEVTVGNDFDINVNLSDIKKICMLWNLKLTTMNKSRL